MLAFCGVLARNYGTFPTEGSRIGDTNKRLVEPVFRMLFTAVFNSLLYVPYFVNANTWFHILLLTAASPESCRVV